MGIKHQIRRYPSKNHEIVAKLRDAAGAGPPVDPAMRIKRLVAEIAIQMALLHGGDFRVQIDHEKGYILVAPRPPWERNSREPL